MSQPVDIYLPGQAHHPRFLDGTDHPLSDNLLRVNKTIINFVTQEITPDKRITTIVHLLPYVCLQSHRPSNISK